MSRHVVGRETCPECGRVYDEILDELMAERYGPPPPPRGVDPFSPSDHAELARRLAFLAELPLEEGEPS